MSTLAFEMLTLKVFNHAAAGCARQRDAEDPMHQARRSDPPWLFRTYAGHSSAAASNALFKGNLARGQTGLSVAFDLPTQTGYDSDHPLAAGEVGRVGVPVCSLADLRPCSRASRSRRPTPR